MKRTALGSVLALFVFAVLAVPAHANSLENFSVTSTYTSGTGTSAFSGSGSAITFSFSVPDSINGGSTDNNVSISVGFGGSTYAEVGSIQFFSLGALGLFNIDFSTGGNAYEWDFFGPQSYTSTGFLSPGNYPINSGTQTLSGFYVNGSMSGQLDGGTVAVTGPTPEPASLLLLGTGLLGLAFVARRRFAQA
jgi:hypothetical protein